MKKPEDLVITLIQEDLQWEDAPVNLSRFEERISTLDAKGHLILLPEMFSTGFTMNAREKHETMEGKTVRWLLEQARKNDVHVAGSIIIAEGGSYYNRLVWAGPDGIAGVYDKRHLFRMAGEHRVFTAGKRRPVIECRGWRILPLVCYDLRFPLWSRNRDNEYDLLVYLANWPERRHEHWKVLLQARAIENQAYVAGVNRVGRDEKDINYRGSSSVIDPWGTVLAHLDDQRGTVTVTLSRETLDSCRSNFPVWKDADRDLFRQGEKW